MQTQPSKLQLVIKSLIALLVTAAATAIAVAILAVVASKQPENFPIAFLFAFVFTALFTFFLGGPLLLLGAWRRLIRWWSCLLIGFLIGFIPSGLVLRSDFLGAWPLGLYGLVGGLVFWLLWHFWVTRAKPVVATPVAPEQASG